MSKFVYRGSPGYEFFPPGAPSFTPVPGGEVELSDDQAAALGVEFDPVDAPEVFDVDTAKKAELVAKATHLGLDIDKAASVADLRAAVAAAITGQEG